MMLLWVALFLMAVLAAAVVAIGSRKNQADANSNNQRQQLNTRIFQQRLVELEQGKAEQRISPAEYQALKAELELGYLDDMEHLEEAGQQVAKRWPVTVLLVILIPVLALVIYFFQGYRPAVSTWLQTQQRVAPLIDRMQAGTLQPEDLKDIAMADFVYGLQRRAQLLDDAQLWFILGKTYQQAPATSAGEKQQMLGNAATALQRAYHLQADKLDYGLAYLNALLELNQGRHNDETRRTMANLLAVNPNLPQVLFFQAMDAYQQENYQQAIAGWQRLLAMDSQKSQQQARDILKRSIASATAKLEKQAIEKQEQQAESDASASQNTAVIEVEVSVTAAVSLNAGFLMVYAQAQQGPPMPLAIKKLALPVPFPVKLKLTDADSMLPNMRLSAFPEVKLTARISRSGSAKPQPGDWSVTKNQVAVSVAGERPPAVKLHIREQRQPQG